MDCRDFSLVLIVVVDGVKGWNAAYYDVANKKGKLLTVAIWTLNFVLFTGGVLHSHSVIV